MLIPQKATSPLHLTASTYCTPQTQQSPNAVALKNPLGAPMEILELRWQLFTPQTADETFLPGTLGGVVGCKLDMGNVAMTNGFVPIWLFGRDLNLVDADTIDNQNLVNPYVSGQTILQSTTCFYSWKLPKPLYVPAGSTLTPSFSHFGAVPTDVNVIISASARSLPLDTPPPKSLPTPWVASWMSPGFIAADQAGSAQSTETDLMNPHREPVHLQRMGGRVMVVNSESASVTDYTYPQIASTLMSVRMSDSMGRQIIRDYTSMMQAFATNSRGWEMGNGARLDPESYLIAYLNKVESAEAGDAANINCQAQISLVGWRELSL